MQGDLLLKQYCLTECSWHINPENRPDRFAILRLLQRKRQQGLSDHVRQRQTTSDHRYSFHIKLLVRGKCRLVLCFSAFESPSQLVVSRRPVENVEYSLAKACFMVRSHCSQTLQRLQA